MAVAQILWQIDILWVTSVLSESILPWQNGVLGIRFGLPFVYMLDDSVAVSDGLCVQIGFVDHLFAMHV